MAGDFLNYFVSFFFYMWVQVETQEDKQPKEAERAEVRLHDEERG